MLLPARQAELWMQKRKETGAILKPAEHTSDCASELESGTVFSFAFMVTAA